MSSSFYVVHSESETIIDLDEVTIVEVKESNEEAAEAIDNDDWEALLDNADRTWSGRTEVSLG